MRTVAFCGTLTVSFQAIRSVAEHLEEEPVQVKRMVLARLVDELPDLELADADVVVALAVASVHQRFHAHRSGRLDRAAGQRLDLAQAGRHLRRRRLRRADLDCRERSRRGSPRPRS